MPDQKDEPVQSTGETAAPTNVPAADAPPPPATEEHRPARGPRGGGGGRGGRGRGRGGDRRDGGDRRRGGDGRGENIVASNRVAKDVKGGQRVVSNALLAGGDGTRK